MKKSVVILVIVVIMIIIITTKIVGGDKIEGLKPTKYISENLDTLRDVSLNAIYNQESKSIDYVIKNMTDNIVYFGNSVVLEKKVNGKWYEVPYSNGTFFTNILLNVLPTEEQMYSVQISAWIYVAAGEYRIIKEVSIQKESNNPYLISASFLIEN